MYVQTNFTRLISLLCRLLSNGWVLIIFGGSTTVTATATGLVSHTFRPMLLTVTRSEMYVAFEETFKQCYKAALEYHGIADLVIEGCTMDRSDATALGLENVLGHRNATVGCFTHVDRKLDEHLISHELTEDGKRSWTLKLELLRRAPSTHTFDFGCEMFLKELNKCGMGDVAVWFKKTYLSTCHRRFAYCHTKPGVPPMNQLLESVNAAIKNLISLYASMPEFCRDCLPKILRFVS
jgi:hypothetical protein